MARSRCGIAWGTRGAVEACFSEGLVRLKDAGTKTHIQISMAKRNNVHMALECARTVRDMLGANGISLEFHTGRHMCNLESVITYEGTHDIHTLAIGHEVSGIPAYR
jgi:glutaryl-CoA dehydrogenase